MTELLKIAQDLLGVTSNPNQESKFNGQREPSGKRPTQPDEP
jgi:hypothetical protein